MSIFSKKNYAEIGKSGGNEDELLAAFKKVATSSLKSRCEKRDSLIDAALQAFREEHPENIQALLSHPDVFSGSNSNYHSFVFETLQKIMEKSEDKPADLSRALDKIPEEKRTEALSYLLYSAVCSDADTEDFVGLMLQSGADVNAEIQCKHAGYILLSAIDKDKPDSVIKQLYGKGARFEDALLIAQGRGTSTKIKVMGCRDRIEGNPADVPEKVLKLERRVDDLEAEVRALKALLEALQVKTSRPMRLTLKT